MGFLIKKALVLILICGLMGFMAWVSFTQAHEAALSMHWPSVKGQVTDTGVQEHWHHHRHYTSHTWAPVVWYEYKVDGKTLQDSRIGWESESFELKDHAENWLKKHKYQRGTEVDVFYDPNHPHHACLITGHGGHQAWMGWFYIGLIVLSLGIVGWQVRGRMGAN
ncbi:MAG: DUF3592 domain-containing protein [Phycisphaerales bacterium]|nr:DUF3592 domain-containing protein [Phycisphaerales bacterium]